MGKLLKVGELAERLRYSRQSIYNEVCKDRFPIKPIRLRGRTFRFDEEDVNRYLEGLKEK